MQFEHIELHIGDTVARLMLNRPERRNALSLAVMREMLAALDDGRGRRESPVLVIEGRGPAFSAGHDLAEMIAQPRDASSTRSSSRTCVRPDDRGCTRSRSR